MDKILEAIEKWFTDNGYEEFYKTIKGIIEFVLSL